MTDNFFKTEIAYDNWSNKYQYDNEKPIETFERIAKTLASNEKNNKDKWYDTFLKTLVKIDKEGNYIGIKCSPGGRTTSNIGTKYGGATLINCFISGPVKNATITYTRENENFKNKIRMKTDDTPDDLVNIFLTILEQAKTLASEGGYGINFDFIRPRGSLIKGTGIRHPGVVSYMEVWDAVAECIVKGDNDGYVDTLKNYLTPDEQEEYFGVVKKMTRKGAMMGCLSVEHPDIEEFVRAKQESGKLTKFNMSVVVSDAFMRAVKNDKFWKLIWKGKTVKKVKARELYDLIMKSTYNRAEPGILFVDNMDKNNPIQYLGKCNATNPCGEIPGNPLMTTVCLLGSINLTQYVEFCKENNDNFSNFDIEQYKKDIAIFTRMLDNVCDLSNLPLPTYEWAVKNLRQFGMGINGLGSTLLMLGIPYNSKKAIEFTKKIKQLKENITMQTSALLAKEKGAFGLFNYEQFSQTSYFKSNRLTDETKELIKKYGIRNAKTTTNPPLGNSSLFCDNVSNAIEPIFALETERKVICEWPEGLNIDNVKKTLTKKTKKDFVYWEGKYNGIKYYYEPHNRGLCEVYILRDYGYQWLLDNFPKKKKEDFVVTVKDLEIDDHLNIQEIVQYYCNQSVSKTINLPYKYSFEKFKELYFNTWKRGLIGVTTYRAGSMESVMESLENAEEKKEIIKKGVTLPTEFINGNTKTIKKEGMKFYIHFSYIPDDREMKYPIAIWINTNNVGDTKACNKACKSLARLAIGCGLSVKTVEDVWDKCLGNTTHNRLGRMISLCLRHNIPREDILVALAGIEGDNISTLLSAVRKFLAETIENGTMLVGIKCPSCGSDDLIMEAGCFKCNDCNYCGCGA